MILKLALSCDTECLFSPANITVILVNFTQKFPVPIPALLPWSLSPSPRCYQGLRLTLQPTAGCCHTANLTACPHPHGVTKDFVLIPTVLPQLLSPLPRYYHGFPAVPICKQFLPCNPLQGVATQQI